MRRGSIASALTSTIGKAAKQLTPGKSKKKTQRRRRRRQRHKNYSSSSSCCSSSSFDFERSSCDEHNHNNSDDDGDNSVIISSVSGSSGLSHDDDVGSFSSMTSRASYSADAAETTYSTSYSPHRGGHRHNHHYRSRNNNNHHHHHHRKKDKRHHHHNHRRHDRKRHRRKRSSRRHHNHHHRNHHHDNHDDDSDRMIDLLMRIIPFYGQGDNTSDNVVIDTIHRLPSSSSDDQQHQQTLEMTDVDGNTLLMVTCQSGAFGLLPILLSKGCDVNARNNVGASCLHYACFAETFSPNAAMTLVRHGAMAEVVESEFGCTPLHWAAYHGHLELCRVLCEAGANPGTIDKNGCDPISYSRESGKDDCTQLLESFLREDGDGRIGGNENSVDQVVAAASSTSFHHQDNKRSDWIRLMDGNMNSFYHNKETGESVWGDDYRSNIEDNKKDGDDEEGEDNKKDDDVHDGEVKENVGESSNYALSNALSLPTVEETKQAADDNVTMNGPKPASSTSQSSSLQTTRRKENGRQQPTPTRLNSWDEELHDDVKKREEDESSSSSLTKSRSSQVVDGSSSAAATVINNVDNDDNGVSNNNMNTKQFEDRLSVLQEKLNNRLESLEEKMVRHKEEEAQSKDDESAVVALRNDLAAMSTTTLDLRTQIGQKDLDILSLKQQIVMLETKLSTKPRTFDVGIGVELTSHDDDESTTGNDEGKRLLTEAQDEISQLQDKLLKITTELNDTVSRCTETEKSLQIAEQTVRDEKSSRESLMRLFEQAKEGQQVDSALTQSLKDEKQRAETTINELRQQLQTLEKECRDRESAAKDELLSQRAKTEKLENDLEQIMTAHVAEIESLKDKHREEEERVFENHKVELQKMNDQLREETLSKMEMEASKYDAVAAMEVAQEKARLATTKLHEMGDLIESSRHLQKNNEALNVSLQKETERRKALHNTIEDMKGRIRVYVRIRPFSESETNSDCTNVMTKEDDRTIAMAADASAGIEARAWEFDKIFCGTSAEGNTQEAVFKDTSLLITSAIDGFNVCIFAYGQTGSGKTYTMFGGSGEDDENKGLATRVANELFSKLRERESSCHVEVEVSMLELYNDKLCDLLVAKQHQEGESVFEQPTLKIRLAEHTSSGLVEVDGLTMEKVTNDTELLHVFNNGVNSRTSASTKMNVDSSRSHMVASIVVSLRHRRSGNIVRGKLTLVDLAGSERVSKSGATGEQLKEAQSINKSLSALGDVIGALTSGSQHVPYRNNPLTMLMSDSIGGNAKSLMFVCCSPSDYNQRESQQSLDFAKRCRNVRNNAQRSSTSTGQLTQIRQLKAELAKIKTKEKSSTVKRHGGMRRPGM